MADQVLTDNSPMPYGKYKGQAMANVPADYLMFLYEQDRCTPPVLDYIEKNLEHIKAERNLFKPKRK